MARRPKKTAQGRRTKYIFISGGVMSSVGKGIAAASIGKILQARGFEVTAIKIDPYVNVDAGTMNPTEHGEVFVLDDGMECDQDMGNYERFLDRDLSRANYMTTGSVYLDLITRERNLEFRGRCVNVVPDVPLEVIRKIELAAKKTKADIVLVEIGGTVGDYQNLLFLEAVRLLKFKQPHDVLLALVSYIPSLSGGGNELKTKPTQHAVRNLNSAGLLPDLVIARAAVALDKKRKEKLEFMCGLEKGSVISAPDVSSVYDVPLNFEKDKISDQILEKLDLISRKRDLKEWRRLSSVVHNAKQTVRIGIVGKYFGTGRFILTDSYISVIEAVKHAAYAVKRKPILEWVDAEEFEKRPQKVQELSKYGGIIVPGGFGSRGVEGIINAIRYCREKKIPYFGLCYGMQLAVVEFARHVAGLKRAHTTEIDKKTPEPVIDIMADQKEKLAVKNYGGTMRLGAYPAILKKGSIAFRAYGGKRQISERHRHRYEVNPQYIDRIEKKGLVFSGTSPDRRLMEIAELPADKHPFFLGTQFHPELKTRPIGGHPLFKEFMKAAAKRSALIVPASFSRLPLRARVLAKKK
ncbi:MAG: CTP synthase [Patescibacteria group bacterium]|nr:CTP synthase [Patescibacteria group bacterium]